MEFDNLYKIRHSTEHVLTEAIENIFPGIQKAMGPAIENGFYFDFDNSGHTISEEDFEKIEKEMQKIIDKNLDFIEAEITSADALELFKDNPYKIELINELIKKGEKLTVYYTGDPAKIDNPFVDLCKGPHVKNTSEIKAFKLLSVAGAYWRGNEKNKMLTRVYGTAFDNKDDLDNHLHMLEEAKKRDHRVLGQKLDLFIFSDLVGKFPLYTPRGFIVLDQMVKFSQSLNKKIGYKEVWTPQVNRAELFKVSGHYDTYREDMMKVVSQYEEEEYFLKPMNCPQHTQIFASQTRSYKDLPIRIADFANLYRDEKPGSLNGLLRLRYFRQDDGHAFCMPEQIEQEIINILGVIKEAAETYGLTDNWIRLSLRDINEKEKYIGDDEIWEKSEATLTKIAENIGINFKVGIGEAAIYGPKLDFMTKDVLGREWQTSTVQLDFNMPKRFGLKYIDNNGEEQTPVMIHRAISGGIERLFGILIEHYSGAFPLWLAPVQCVVVPISSDKHLEYSINLVEQLNSNGLRTELSSENETLNNRIRKAQEQKIPYMIIIGDQEIANNKISLRTRENQQHKNIDVNVFIEKIKKAIAFKNIDLIDNFEL